MLFPCRERACLASRRMGNFNAVSRSASLPAQIAPASAGGGRKRIPQLDGVRGLAILMVLVWHYYVCTPAPPTAINTHLKIFLSLAWTGVDLFFVLSGFLIGGILMDHREDDDYFKVFYVRRVCRIFPLYFLLLIAGAIYVKITGESASAPLPFWPYPFFLQSIFIATRGALGSFWLGGTWSLAIEEQFYLIFPFLVRVCKSRLLPHLFVIMVLLAPVCRIVLWSMSHPPGLASFALLPCRMDQLALGALGAWMIRQPAMREWLEARSGWLLTYLALSAAAFIALSLRQWALLSDVMASFGHTWMGLVYLLVILLGVTSQDARVLACYKFAPLRALGKLSYFIYLFHPIVAREVYVLLRHGEPQLYSAMDCLATALAFGITLLLASLSWALIEKPIIEIGHRCKYRPPGAATG